MKAALVISAGDNVATSLETLEPGRTMVLDRHAVTVAERIPRGHKVALCAIGAGDAVVKYGSPIGNATADIAPGAHVHTHNLASTRGRGDLPQVSTFADVAPASPRIAEPVDLVSDADSAEGVVSRR